MKKTSRAYNISDAALIQLGDAIYNAATRDLDYLTGYGNLEVVLPDLLAKRNIMESTNTDQECSIAMCEATLLKNELRHDVEHQIRQIADRAKIHYGNDYDVYRLFATEGLSRSKDSDIVTTGIRVFDIAQEYQSDLLICGINQSMIADMGDLTNLYQKQINIRNRRIVERDLAVESRIRAGNDLYKLIVYVSSMGKLCFGPKNMNQYNSYVLYHPSKPTTQQLEGDINPNTVVNLSVTDIKQSTTLEITNPSNSNFTIYFAEEPTDQSGKNQITIKPQTTIRIKAGDLGFDKKNCKWLNIFNSSEETNIYKISI